MSYIEKYDRTSPKSIEEYAKKLIGYTFEDIIELNKKDSKELNKGEIKENTSLYYGNRSRKGGLGNLLEEIYFGYNANSISEPDFPEAGVELKITPFEKKKNGSFKAGERLVLGMISYDKEIEDNLYDSHIWNKCKLLLLIYYLRDKRIKDNLLYTIRYATLFQPTEADLKIIEQDYKIIVDKIKAGKAHELSESDTMYLGACTKGSTAEKSLVKQYYNTNVKAKKRAFCYKNTYMTFILNNYIIPNKNTYEENVEPIIRDVDDLKNCSFDEYIKSKINKNIGKTDEELCLLFDREYNNNKAQWIDLSYRMLGIKSNKAEEFIKANIVVKAVRIEENGNMVESSSLPTICFKELVKQEWEDSDLFKYFETTKFLFVVYKKQGEHYVLKGCKLWNMPYEDLNVDLYQGWKNIRDTVEKGTELEKKETKNGIIIKNNLPNKNANRIIHIRPHTSKTFYKFEDGEIFGKGTYVNGDELPDGRWMTKQSFWINNSYIISQLQDIINQ